MERLENLNFFRSYWDAIRELPDKEQLPILRAIITYGLDGTEPEGLSAIGQCVFTLVKPHIEISRKRAAARLKKKDL